MGKSIYPCSVLRKFGIVSLAILSDSGLHSGLDESTLSITSSTVRTHIGSEAIPTLTPDEAADLRGKLAAWEEDWNAPGMEAYDDYETRRRGSGPVSAQ